MLIDRCDFIFIIRASWPSVFGRCSFYDNTHTHKQIYREQNRLSKHENDGGQRQPSQTDDGNSARHAHHKVACLGELFLTRHNKYVIRNYNETPVLLFHMRFYCQCRNPRPGVEISQRAQIPRRIMRILLGDDADINFDFHLHNVYLDGQQIDGCDSIHHHCVAQYAHSAAQRFPVGAERSH